MTDLSHEELAPLKTAFALHVARMIVEADEVLDYDEMHVIERAFPSSRLRALGFLDDSGRFTSRYDDALARALQVLPREVTLAEKLELVTLFHRTCMADGDLDPREVKVLHHAAEMIDLSAASLARHLDAISHGRRAPPIRKP